MLPAKKTCDKVKEMDENKDQARKVSTCFEGSSFAEMMQKIMGEEGIGSLCEEMMRSLIKKLNEDIEKSQKTKKEEN
jgi:hypothetical protein